MVANMVTFSSPSIPFLSSKSGTLGDDGRRCVPVCLSAHRSLPAVRLLRKHGRADAAHLAGGMRAWWKAGLPTEKA